MEEGRLEVSVEESIHEKIAFSEKTAMIDQNINIY